MLHRCAQDGPAGFAWSEEGFAVAEGYDATTQRYLGLVVGPGGGAAVSVSTLLVRPDVAAAQLRVDDQASSAQAAATIATTASAGRVADSPASTPLAADAPISPGKPRRFHGSVALRSERLSLEFGRVVQEVIAHLSDASTNVEVTIEISASAPDGFDEPVIRTVTENARTLHFSDQGFEEE